MILPMPCWLSEGFTYAKRPLNCLATIFQRFQVGACVCRLQCAALRLAGLCYRGCGTQRPPLAPITTMSTCGNLKSP